MFLQNLLSSLATVLGPGVFLAWDGVGRAQIGRSQFHWQLSGAEMCYFFPFALLCFHLSLCSKLIMFLSASVFMEPTLWSEK